MANDSAQTIIQNRKSGMVILFTILILLFGFIALIFAYVNDFSHELLPIIFPAVGAVLFSGYLGAKAIFVDAPPVETETIHTAFMQNFENGYLHSVVSRRLLPDSPDISSRFEGLRAIEDVQHYEAFKPLEIPKTLKAPSTNDLMGTEAAVAKIVEFAVFTRLSGSAYGQSNQKEAVSLTGYGRGGSIISDPKIVSSIDVASDNDLLMAFPYRLLAETGSKIQSRTFGSRGREIVFDSPTSKLTIRLYASAGGVFDPGINSLSSKLHLALGAPAQPGKYWFTVYSIDLSFESKPVRRFSTKAVLAKEWYFRLKSDLSRDFSWDELRAAYAK